MTSFMAISFASSKARPVPEAYRRNFNHLILDIAWFGVLNGSAVAFVAVYATRLGASAFQLGLLNAMPAVVNLLFALPAGRWLQARPISRATFYSSVIHRWFYLVWVFLPFFFGPMEQVWLLVLLTVLMSIPGTALAIGFNGLFAATVPPEWRAQVVGVRNAAYALTSIVVTLIAGWLLNAMPFPVGYQLVFLIGFIGAAMSSLHLWLIHPADEHRKPANGDSLGDWAQPGATSMWQSLRMTVGLRFLMRQKPLESHWFNPLKDFSYRRVLLLVFAVHLALYLAVPLFPIYLVRELGLNDQVIGLGNSIFYVALFLVSARLDTVTQRLGHRRTMALGVLIISLYPALLSLAHDATLYLVASIMGGAGWALAGGAVGNFVLEKTPDNSRPSYLAWYNMSLQAGILLGALIAPLMAGWWGLTIGLAFAAVCRFLTGLAIWRTNE
jgi:MFS family permease